jgi:Tol biopolymer transport system component/DNA-binding winged helix-turn-helix (wHTH) protein
MTVQRPGRFYRFGECVVDTRRRCLWRSRQLVPLTAKTFDVLVFLLRHPNRVIEKAEFFNALWPDTHVLEANLVRQMSLLRRALGEQADTHAYIVTIPGRGYELVADVEELPDLPAELAAPAEAHPDSIGSSVQAPPQPEGRISVEMRYRILAACVALLVLGAVVWQLTAERASNGETQRTLRQITFESGAPREPSWAPGGKTLVFASDASGNPDLWIQILAEARPRQLTRHPAVDAQPSFSPDGEWIVFRSERDGGGLFKVRAHGGPEERLTDFGHHPQWSPAGDLILFSGSTVRTGTRKLFVVRPDGGDEREIAADAVSRFTSGSTTFGWLNSVRAAWHPDGRRISLWGREADGTWTFQTIAVAGGALRRSRISEETQEQLRTELTLGRFIWSATGRHLFFEGERDQTRNIWRVAINPSTLDWIGNPERLTTSAGEDADIAVSPGGGALVFTIRATRTRLWAIEFDAREGRVLGTGEALTSGSAGEMDADATPDGRKLAYRAVRAGRNELWELDTTNGAERLLLTSSGWRPSPPRWSSDGRRLVYGRRPTADPRNPLPVLAVLSAEDRREQLISLPSGAFMDPSDWSADGALILGSCSPGRDGPVAVCSIAAEIQPSASAALRVIARDPSHNLWVPRFSPDQRWIAFVSVSVTDAPTSQVFVSPAGGGQWVPMTDGASFDDKPRWSPDGRTIYFISSREGALNVWGRRFDPVAGQPVGDTFRVTSFSGRDRILPSAISQIDFGITADKLFLPLAEQVGNLWLLEGADR